MREKIKNACEFAKDVIHALYVERDVKKVLSAFAENISWIGPAELDFSLQPQDVQRYFIGGKRFVPPCDICDEEYDLLYPTRKSCIVQCRYTIHTKESSSMLIEIHQRMSLYIVLKKGKLQILHQHISNPSSDMKEEGYFPTSMSKQNFDYMQTLLREKSEVLDMIAENVDGGLKGSNDDETFSFFYVNNGLPHMLGYTYDEFMQMSNGSAVGAVYPPDLEQALASVAVCFAQGTTYSAEYRIKAKSGELIWVVDSGRKVVNEKGETKINSIITNVNDYKQAVEQLEIERERYLIVLKNISDVIFEYNIKTDVYSIYKHDKDNNIIIENTQNYSKEVVEKERIHIDDMNIYCDMCHGYCDESIDIRIRDFAEGINDWIWVNMQTSVLKDSDGNPVKVLGTMKNINKQKEEVQKLIDRTMHDPLTKLYNQSCCVSETEKLLALTPRKPCAMLVIDFDHFKNVNDTLGHLKGNEALLALAEILRKFDNDKTVLARVGGDEFLAFFYDVTKIQAETYANKILNDVKSINFGSAIKLSCSIGAVYSKSAKSNYKTLFTSADRELYAAKHSRNCFIMAIEK